MRTHCFKGHPLTEDNLYYSHHSDGHITRKCKLCNLEKAKEIRERKRVAARASYFYTGANSTCNKAIAVNPLARCMTLSKDNEIILELSCPFPDCKYVRSK